MKSFTALKIAMGLGALVALAAFAPVSRAQSEIAPDHFDGTDPWATAAPAHVAKVQVKTGQSVPSTLVTRSGKPASPSAQPVSVRTAVSSRRSEPKRKPSTSASN